jgi:hypothetical protein
VLGPYDPNYPDRYYDPTPDPDWDYSRVTVNEDLSNVRHDMEYYAKQFYEPPPTGVESLPRDTFRELLREAYCQITGQPSDAVIPYDGAIVLASASINLGLPDQTADNWKNPHNAVNLDGTINIQAGDGTVFAQAPNQYEALYFQMGALIAARIQELGLLDANGMSTLPLDNYQQAEQNQRDAVQKYIDAQNAREAAGTQKPIPGNDHYTGSTGDKGDPSESAPSAPTGGKTLEDDPGVTSTAEYDGNPGYSGGGGY